MVSTLSQNDKIVSNITPNGQSKFISWETFQRKYLTREDGFKYEWLNGVVEKTKRTMDFKQLYILQNLQDFFYALKASGLVSGLLASEGDVFFVEKHRRPDIAYFTHEQVEKAADGFNPTPQFVMEVISNTDAINRVNDKILNYRQAEVQIVWHIFPNQKEVHVYCGDNLDTVLIRRGDMICSATPVLPNFEISVADIFKREAS